MLGSPTPDEISFSPSAVSQLDDASVYRSAVSDKAIDDIKDDVLGFKPYIQAVAAFLTDENTKPPLAISIEGEWGSGKSSFMLALKRYLDDSNDESRDNSSQRKFHTVLFNAWRHDKDDSLWATFALEFVHQLSCQLRPIQRRLANLKLFWRRRERLDATTPAARNTLLGLAALLLLAAAIVLNIAGTDTLKTIIVNGLSAKDNPIHNTVGALLKFGGFAGILGYALYLFDKAKKFASLDLEKYIERPDYTKRVSFFEHFHKDFANIVEAYATQEGKVFAFIDDIDRCEPAKAADLMQAMNMMINDTSQIIFIVGMDRKRVAAALAVKNKELLPYTIQITTLPAGPGVPVTATTTFDPDIGLAYGYRYIEKFIQLPFRVPKPKVEDVYKLVSASNTNHPSADSHQPQANNQALQVNVSKDAKDFQKIIEALAPFLDNNPRRIKQFANLLRLRQFISYNTRLLPSYLSLQQLAKLVILDIEWPLLLNDLEDNPFLLGQLHLIATTSGLRQQVLSGDFNQLNLVPLGLSESVSGNDLTNRQKSVTQKWAVQQDLLELIRHGQGAAGNNYCFENFDATKYLETSVASPVVTTKATGGTIRTRDTAASSPSASYDKLGSITGIPPIDKLDGIGAPVSDADEAKKDDISRGGYGKSNHKFPDTRGMSEKSDMFYTAEEAASAEQDAPIVPMPAP